MQTLAINDFISKYDLISLFKEAFNKDIVINKNELETLRESLKKLEKEFTTKKSEKSVSDLSSFLEIKEETFIQASKISGHNALHIMIKHILPNILAYLIVTASLDIGTVIMEMSSLSFLGLSSPLPTPEWGAMISEGKSVIQFAPWTLLAPGLAILIVVVLFNLLGDIIRDLLDLKEKERFASR